MCIPKPWGQEIWYTGVEERGVSRVRGMGSPVEVDLPWFLVTLPRTLLGDDYAQKSLVLIKILDPLPLEVYGDLYYELHQEKNEVYIVTDIVGEKGHIKMGVHPDKLQQYQGKMMILKRYVGMYRALRNSAQKNRQHF